MSTQIIGTILILLAGGGYIWWLNRPKVTTATTTTSKSVIEGTPSIGTLAEQFASIRKQVEAVGDEGDVEAFDKYASFLFRSLASKPAIDTKSNTVATESK